MQYRTSGRIIHAYGIPLLAIALSLAIGTLGRNLADAGGLWPAALSLLAAIVLISNVFASLVHAETIAARVGEPVGTLVLTLAITLIEASLIASAMFHGENNPTLARESVFSAVMIVMTGLVGSALFIGSLTNHDQRHRTVATSAHLAVLVALCSLVLILPDYTESTSAGTFSSGQLAFAGTVSALLYLAFLYIQTVRHREDFLEVEPPEDGDAHTRPPRGATAVAAVWLLLALAGVVLLAEHVAAALENALASLSATRSDAIMGAMIAVLVLMPEGISALKAAGRNAVQRSLNISLGSALASIGLTIPAISAISLVTGREIILGLPPRDTFLLLLALAV